MTMERRAFKLPLELVEQTGGVIDIDKLPIGDKTLSSKDYRE